MMLMSNWQSLDQTTEKKKKEKSSKNIQSLLLYQPWRLFLPTEQRKLSERS